MAPSPLREIEAKTGLSRANLAEPFLVSLYRVTAPYRGCGHGCRYCDGRAEKYFVEGDFERDISVRANLPSLIAADVAAGVARNEWGAVCVGSGVTDVYQPVEAERGLMRGVLEALIPAGLPIVILTKSDLILRDFDLLSRFPQALIIFTVTTTDPDIAGLIEPGAPSPARRLEAVRRAREAGFHSGIMAMPYCPGLSDARDQAARLISAAAESGAEFVYPGGLTLRPGRQKDLFLSLIDSRFPSLRPLYDRLYAENRQSGAPLGECSRQRAREWAEELRQNRMPEMIPHSAYRDLLCPPDALFVLLCHMQSLYAARGVDVRPLQAATERYADWLKAERSALHRLRKKEEGRFAGTARLSQSLLEMCREDLSGTAPLSALLQNEKLARLVTEVIAQGKLLEYPTLTLR
jgi:DNA repair photolyase